MNFHARTFRFRAKTREDKKWVEGDLCHDDKYNTCIMTNGNKLVRVDFDTVCQSTWVKDKHGRFIFEGDLVCIEFQDGTKVNGEVRFYSRGGCVGSPVILVPTSDGRVRVRHPLDIMAGNAIQVIGDVFDGVYEVDMTRPVPCVNLIKGRTIGQQVDKIHEEYNEVRKALVDNNPQNLEEELVDLQIACETALHMLGNDKQRRKDLMVAANKKNYDRNYW